MSQRPLAMLARCASFYRAAAASRVAPPYHHGVALSSRRPCAQPHTAMLEAAVFLETRSFSTGGSKVTAHRLCWLLRRRCSAALAVPNLPALKMCCMARAHELSPLSPFPFQPARPAVLTQCPGRLPAPATPPLLSLPSLPPPFRPSHLAVWCSRGQQQWRWGGIHLL